MLVLVIKKVRYELHGEYISKNNKEVTKKQLFKKHKNAEVVIFDGDEEISRMKLNELFNK